MTLSFVSGYHILYNFEILYFWTDLAEIGLRGRILGVAFESEMIFHIRGQYKPILAISCILPPKKRQTLLNNRVAIATVQDIDN